MKSVINTCLKVLFVASLAGGLSACDGVAIWDSSRASGPINTEISEFLNAETDEQKAKGLEDIRRMTGLQNMIFDGWNSVLGYMAMYYDSNQREAVLNDYNQARDALGLSLLIARASFDVYCQAVANCTMEEYNALLNRGQFVKASLEVAKPGLTERLALFKARYPSADLNTIDVTLLSDLLFDDEALLAFLTDETAALEFIARDISNRRESLSLSQALNLLKPVDVTITPALGS